MPRSQSAPSSSKNDVDADTSTTAQQQQTRLQAKRPPRKKHMKKAPGAPRRFKTAFIFFSTAKHKEIREQLGSRGSKQKTPNIAKMVGEAWRNLTKEERVVWDELAAKDKARFELEKSIYKGPWQVPTNSGGRGNDPETPRRPCPAFVAFLNSKRTELKESHPDASPREVMRIGAKMWHAATPDERGRHLQAEARALEKYKRDLKDWRDSKPEVQLAARREEMAWIALEAQENQGKKEKEPSSSTSCHSLSRESNKRKEYHDDDDVASTIMNLRNGTMKKKKKGETGRLSPPKPDPAKAPVGIKKKGSHLVISPPGERLKAGSDLQSSRSDQKGLENKSTDHKPTLPRSQMGTTSASRHNATVGQLPPDRVGSLLDSGSISHRLLAANNNLRAMMNQRYSAGVAQEHRTAGPAPTRRQVVLHNMLSPHEEDRPGSLHYASRARQQEHQRDEARRTFIRTHTATESQHDSILASLLLQQRQKQDLVDELVTLTILEKRRKEELLSRQILGSLLLDSSPGTGAIDLLSLARLASSS